MALVPLACLVVAGNALTTPLLFRLNQKRAMDIENLVCSAHADKVKQIAQTHEYLRSAAGQQPTGLNSYIRRVSLPRLAKEVAQEREHLPAHCKDPSAF